MKFQDYELSTFEAHRVEGQYEYLDHGEKFRIRVRNGHHTHCNVDIRVNGIHVGCWRLLPFQTAYLESPVGSDMPFVFQDSDKPDIGDDDGLIVATFIPESRKDKYVPVVDDDVERAVTIAIRLVRNQEPPGIRAKRPVLTTGIPPRIISHKETE